MELREINLNTLPSSSIKKRNALIAAKPPIVARTTAMYISPPRNPVVVGAAQQQQQQQQQYAQQQEESQEPHHRDCRCPSCEYFSSYRCNYQYQQHQQAMNNYNGDSNSGSFASSEQQQHAAQAAVHIPMHRHNLPRMSRTSLKTVAAVPVMAIAQRHSAASTPAAEMHSSAPTQQQQPHMMRMRVSPQAPAMSMMGPACSPAATVAAPTDGVGMPAATPVMSPVEIFHAEYAGHVVEAACTVNGKAALQSAIRTRDPSVIEVVLREVSEQLEVAALDPNACHVVRAALENATMEQMQNVVYALHETLILNMCTVSQYTRRIVQAIFERRLVDLSAVVDVLSRNAPYLSATQQGCISLMRVFEQCDEEEKAVLVQDIVPTFANIAFDPFGNYVVQCVIEHSAKSVAAQYIVSCFSFQLLTMSCDKFASNVVEMIVRSCGDAAAVRRMLLDELIYNPASLKEMVNDSFGNFVVQAIIDSITQPMEVKRVGDRLKPALHGCQYATKIDAKLKAKKTIFEENDCIGAGANYHHQHGLHYNQNNFSRQYRGGNGMISNNSNNTHRVAVQNDTRYTTNYYYTQQQQQQGW